MPKKIIHPGQLGPFYPARRADTGKWYVCRYDKQKRSTSRTAGPFDGYRECEEGVARAFLAGTLIESPEPSLDIIFARYLQYMMGRPSAPHAGASVERLYEFFEAENIAPSRTALTQQFQRRFIAWRGRSCGGNMISRDLSVYRAALQRAFRRGDLSAPHAVIDVEPDRKAGPRQRVLERDEIAALMDAGPDHLFLFLFISLNTAARPAAALELRPRCCDYDRRLIDLNAGQPLAHHAKTRPIVPMTDAFKRQLESRDGERFILGQRGPLKSIRKAFATARDAAGISPDVVPYTLRHTVATELRSRDVPEWECMGFMGHSRGTTTERYAKYRPDYLSAARIAIDNWMDEIPSDRILRSGCDPKPRFAPEENSLTH